MKKIGSVVPRFFFQIPFITADGGNISYEPSAFIYLFYKRHNVKMLIAILIGFIRCGNVASILELDEHLGQEYKVFQHAPVVSDHIFNKLLLLFILSPLLALSAIHNFRLGSNYISHLLAGHP